MAKIYPAHVLRLARCEREPYGKNWTRARIADAIARVTAAAPAARARQRVADELAAQARREQAQREREARYARKVVPFPGATKPKAK